MHSDTIAGLINSVRERCGDVAVTLSATCGSMRVGVFKYEASSIIVGRGGGSVVSSTGASLQLAADAAVASWLAKASQATGTTEVALREAAQPDGVYPHTEVEGAMPGPPPA